VAKDTSGWKSLGGNDPTKYQATLDLDQTSGRRNPLTGQTDSKQKVIYITDRATGSYDAYAEGAFGSRSLIYQYNPSTNQPNIVDQNQYDKLFAGENSQQYTNTHKEVRIATLALAKENVSGNTSRKEYQELQNTTGYKSLANTVEPPAATDDDPAPVNTGEEQGSGSSAVDNGTLTGGDIFNGSVDSFLAPDGFSSGSNLSFTDFGSLGGDAFLGTADDITAAGDSFAFGVANPGIIGKDNTEFNTDDKFFTRQFAEDGEILKYPEADLTSFGFDYIQITGHKYTTLKAGGFGAFGKGSKSGYEVNDFKDQNGVSSKLGQVTKIIQLPMQPNLSESNAVDWNQDEINEIQRRAAGLAASGITGIRNAKGIGDGMSVAANLLGSGSEIVKNMLTNEKLGPFITAYFAGQAVGANIVGRSTGQVLNKNLELLFKGPKLRQFSFNFTFTPRSNSEALTIKKMIRFFKKSMAPEISPERIFLYTPDIFQLQYIHNSGGGHPYLNRFKPCALTNFSANYTPGNSYMTYKDGSMTQYQVAMTFSELEPIYQGDHDVAGGTGY